MASSMKRFKTLGNIFVAAVYLFFATSLFSPGVALAKCTKEQEIEAIATNRPFYCEDDSTAVCSGSLGGENTGIEGGSTIWQSGLSAPFILEQYAVETLKI